MGIFVRNRLIALYINIYRSIGNLKTYNKCNFSVILTVYGKSDIFIIVNILLFLKSKNCSIFLLNNESYIRVEKWSRVIKK